LSIGDDIELQLPHKLARAWEDQEREQGLPERESYHEIELSHSEMKAIFDPVVKENLDLIAAQLSQTPDIKVMLVVGGFAGSPYLMTRIKNSFAAEVERIISPPNPGSAVCQGAVALAMNPGAIISRIARKTYGIEVREDFEEGDPAEYCIQVGNRKMCDNRFAIYVQKGSQVAVDHCVTKKFFGSYPRQKRMRVGLYSSDDVSPRYTTGGSAEEEGKLVIDISNVSGKRDAIAEVSVSMYFGRSSIEMEVVGLNCGDKSKVHELQLPLTFGGVSEGLEKPV
jgi:putative intracellular protease/amidase